LWNSDVVSVFITHQVFVRAPRGLRFIQPLLNGISRWFIKKYDQCWVPDFPDMHNLSGELSHGKVPDNVRYIGPLSRFHERQSTGFLPLLVVISGPEPQRRIFEKKVLRQLRKIPLHAVVVRGLPGKEKESTRGDIRIFDHLPADRLNEYMVNAGCVISRPGYSTIMDLARLQKKAIFIPTPGQTEQEYLASLHKKNKNAWFETQKEMDLARALVEYPSYKGFVDYPDSGHLLHSAVSTLTDS
jgi:hypothetical protein